MPKEHLKLEDNRAVCGWPWNNQSANYVVIAKNEIDAWLRDDIDEVTCKNCIKKLDV